MPNVCLNHLTVAGNAERLEELYVALGSPEPEVPQDDLLLPWRSEVEGLNDGTLEYIDAQNNVMFYGPNVLHMHYITGWGPCKSTLTTLSKQFPDLRFENRFSQDGDCFRGFLIFDNGECVHDFCEDLDPDLCDDETKYHEVYVEWVNN